MTQQAKEFWKIWGTPLSVLIGCLGLCWAIMSTFGSIIYGDVKELHRNSDDIVTIQN